MNPGGPKRPFQKMDEFGGRRPKKKVDKCAPKPDFPGRPAFFGKIAKAGVG